MIIVLKRDDEAMLEFEITDVQLRIADELGIPRQKFITEYAKLKLTAHLEGEDEDAS